MSAVPTPNTSLNFRTSPLGQRLSSLANPSAALQLLSLKRQQYTSLQQQSSSAQRQCIQALLDQLMEERERMELMPTVRRRYKDKRRHRVVSRLSGQMDVSPQSPVSLQSIVGLWQRLEGYSRRPDAREGATLTAFAQKVILVGGASRSIFSDTWVLYALNPQWTQAHPPGPNTEPRMGHSAVNYKGQVLLFGGETAFNRDSQQRECLNTVRCLKGESVEWQPVLASGAAVDMRRYHVAAIVGKHMVVYGGLSGKNAYLADCMVLNLESWRWKSVEIHGKGPGFVAFQAAVSVYPGFNNEKSCLFSSQPCTEAASHLKQPGVYVFGGLDANSKVLGSLYVLQTGQRPLSWLQPEVSGTKPAPRFQHSFTLLKELNSLVLFGGRNSEKSAEGYCCFGDLYLLDLGTLLWRAVRTEGCGPGARCAHVAAAAGGKVVVFGGVDGGKYCSGDTFVLEMQPQDCSKEQEIATQRQSDFQPRPARASHRSPSGRSTLRAQSAVNHPTLPSSNPLYSKLCR